MIPDAHRRERERTVLPDGFRLTDRDREKISGGHALILDDTWTSGAKAQSAALAVRAAGSAMVHLLAPSIGSWFPLALPGGEVAINVQLDGCTSGIRRAGRSPLPGAR